MIDSRSARITLERGHLEALAGQLRSALGEVESLLGSQRSCLASMGEPSVHASPANGHAGPGSTMIAAPQTAPKALLLSARELAALLGCNSRTLRRWRQQRGFPTAITMGKSKRWRRREVERWLEERSR